MPTINQEDKPMSYRKIGGMRWLRIGRLRIAWCVVKPKHDPLFI
jgi:hypothetical protein